MRSDGTPTSQPAPPPPPLGAALTLANEGHTRKKKKRRREGKKSGNQQALPWASDIGISLFCWIAVVPRWRRLPDLRGFHAATECLHGGSTLFFPNLSLSLGLSQELKAGVGESLLVAHGLLEMCGD